jgi:hypothetical protein
MMAVMKQALSNPEALEKMKESLDPQAVEKLQRLALSVQLANLIAGANNRQMPPTSRNGN